MGLNGLGVRARAADCHALAFDLLFVNEPAANPEERFQQDDKLFGFVTNAMAASEAIVFSSFIVARAYDSDPLEEAQLKTPLKGMLCRIASLPETQLLGTFLKAARAEKVGDSLIELRDVLLHRGRLPRHHWVGGRHDRKITVAENPKGIPSSWRPDRYLDAGGLSAWCDWLDRYIAGAIPLIRTSLAGIP